MMWPAKILRLFPFWRFGIKRKLAFAAKTNVIIRSSSLIEICDEICVLKENHSPKFGNKE